MMLKNSEQQDEMHAIQLRFTQSKALLSIMLLIYVPVLMLFAILKLQTKIPISILTRDPSSIAQVPSYWGAISNIGILMWCGAVVIPWFSFKLLQQTKNNKEFSRFFLFSGCLTSILLLDDLFLLHEGVFPNRLKIPEKFVLVGYGIILSFYLIKFRKVILKTNFILLVFALSFFGLSAIFDSLPLRGWLENEDQYLVEDGLKFLGIVSWLTYFAITCADQLKRILRVETTKHNRF
ncbi:hypothetical protein QUB80_12735 [Chlorogloeopsis sp. ULAP01]|uniref:hypothetical protein n=1 Tax=Chlorogloeopsis sp. ULAP01 TaxID=3056483 RepID=UPI0025AA9301|nr:hypothetical protein [Chlorogloeopsis sp. ULAP01]MDM9381567.1 hypothetical protein [Chlorogloeopsis sp. ULAP01]